jgi:RNA polymerase sigma factor (sigma-70 family)
VTEPIIKNTNKGNIIMEKDLINSSEVTNEEIIQLPNIEWDDYSSADYCAAQCVYFDKCSGNRERCVKKAFDNLLTTLTEREEMVLKLRWGFYKNKCFTLDEVAECLEITRERARQIEAKSLRKLRHPSRQKMIVGNGGAITCASSVEFYEKLIDAVLGKN